MNRKLRKLVKSPYNFFSDMGKNFANRHSHAMWLLIRQIEIIIMRLYAVFGIPRPQNPRYTIVSAVYNVDQYLDKFFESIFSQRLFLHHIQVIVIDDGSTDDSCETIARWSKRYRNIEYYKKTNGGQASARNFGIEKAKGKWITFIDSDDFISDDYFSYVDSFQDSSDSTLSLISTNFIFYHEKTHTFRENHPLSYRYKEKYTLKSISNLGTFVQLGVNHAFFSLSLINTFNIRFDERVKPNFEDAKFAAQYMLNARGDLAAFLSVPKYYYRKRADESSTLDLSGSDPRLYKDVIQYGMIELLEEASIQFDYIPVWLQRTCLYSIVWTIRSIYRKSIPKQLLSKSKIRTFLLLTKRLFELIDEDVIWSFELAYISELDKVALSSLYKSGDRPIDRVWVKCADRNTKDLFIVYSHFGKNHDLIIQSNSAIINPLSCKTVKYSLFDDLYCFKSFIRFNLSDSSRISIHRENKTVYLSGFEGITSDGVWTSALIRKFSNAPLDDLSFPIAHRNTRRRANLNRFREKYRGAWVFMDRDTHADDNAEHFYRFVSNHYPELRCYFILARDSTDWDRLLEEGFSLIPFHSEDHAMSALHCDYLISSHCDLYIYDFPEKKYYRDYLLSRKFVFLQHGVTEKDNSEWFNSKGDCHLVVTSTPDEYRALVENYGAYVFEQRQVALTGMPRFDSLLALEAQSKKRVLIAPTWRSYIVGESTGVGNTRSQNENFVESLFFKKWNELLTNQAFTDAAMKGDVTLTLLIHPNIQPYLNLFNLPDDLDISLYGGQSIQPLLASTSVLLTDYSSVAFDVAYLGKPVIYYQFDEDEFFSRGPWRRGYFDYRRDGFGPVVTTADQVVTELSKLVDPAIGLDDIVHKRILDTFGNRDGQCCQRVFDAIMARE